MNYLDHASASYFQRKLGIGATLLHAPLPAQLPLPHSHLKRRALSDWAVLGRVWAPVLWLEPGAPGPSDPLTVRGAVLTSKGPSVALLVCLGELQGDTAGTVTWQSRSQSVQNPKGQRYDWCSPLRLPSCTSEKSSVWNPRLWLRSLAVTLSSSHQCLQFLCLIC